MNGNQKFSTVYKEIKKRPIKMTVTRLIDELAGYAKIEAEDEIVSNDL